MNNLQMFENHNFGRIRTLERSGDAWFVGKDVAQALGYKDTINALKTHVDPEDKQGGWQITTPSGTQQMTIINESGLYSLVLSSKMPGAKAFKRWITSEVIPAIRKHGAYMTPDTIKQALLNPDTIIQLATKLKDEQEKRKSLESEVTASRPKVVFADAVSTSESSILIGELAKLLKQNGVKNMGQNRLFDWMRNNGYLIRRKGTDYNMPTQRSMEMALMEIKETSISHADGHVSVNKTPKITGKGQIYFLNLFLKPKKESSNHESL